MTAAMLSIGGKVHYISGKGKDIRYHNGIIKDFGQMPTGAFVVYDCNEDWENYKRYTGILTPLKDLNLGWYEVKVLNFNFKLSELKEKYDGDQGI